MDEIRIGREKELPLWARKKREVTGKKKVQDPLERSRKVRITEETKMFLVERTSSSSF